MTLVVCPLIALMKDQVDALKAKGIAAEMIGSSQAEDNRGAAKHRQWYHAHLVCRTGASK